MFTALVSLVTAAVAVLLVFHLRQTRKTFARSMADLKRRAQDRESRERKRTEQTNQRLDRISKRLAEIESKLATPPESPDLVAPPACGGDAPLHVVVSLPKCGSSTMVATLTRAFAPATVHHVHSLSKQGSDHLAERWLKKGTLAEKTGHGLRNLRISREARMALEERRARHGSPAGYYLCGVREPVAMAVSIYFQRTEIGDDPPDWAGIRDFIIQDWVLTESGLFTGGMDHWFDREIRDILGIDVFAIPFDRSRGYQVLDHTGARLLVIRQENLDALRPALGDLYRCQEHTFEIISANRASEKPVADIYRQALERLRFDEELLKRTYNSRYARHFYSADELEAFRTRWLDRSGGVS